MEKTKLIMFNDLDIEEPVPCNGCIFLLVDFLDICELEDQRVRVAYLDDLYANSGPPSPNVMGYIDNKALREIKGTFARH